MKPGYFECAADFRAWLETNHKTVGELWVGFYKKSSGRGGLTHLEAREDALCFGWIDGVRKRVDDLSLTRLIADSSLGRRLGVLSGGKQKASGLRND